MNNEKTVIIGSGLQGQLLVQGLRKAEYPGKIDLFCGDSGDFYHKPQLSCAFTQRNTQRSRAIDGGDLR